MSVDVLDAINVINQQLPMAKAIVDSDGTNIILRAEVLVDTLSRTELLFAIDLVSSAADHFDTLLQKRFGGSTMLEEDGGSVDV